MLANVVASRGTSHAYAERALAANITLLGHKRVKIQSDQEPATLDVKNKAQQHAMTEPLTDLKCALLNLKSGDAAPDHMVAEDRGEGQTGEPLGQIGKWADITENTVDEFAATHGCRGCPAREPKLRSSL